ncbi:Mss4-like protein [Gilbertella persicaria]|uniref:Mss4-like protein n=1 Tax=Gilbertella persicaria TaxID=101096 RepID=UPI00221E88FC|nr:Mss4-like protein [Gilbertella persicaria]KAI8091336.1 Mss4-like protein [Gilbertella persicaria]
MLLYTDILTGDELFSDAFPLKLIDDVAYEVDCKMITIAEGDIDIGANPSAEGGDDEGADDQSQTVNNVVHSFRLVQTSFDKKSYMVYIKGYMKAVKAQLPAERVPDFEKNVAALVKKILGNFKDYEFYIGESMNPDGMVALLNYREDGITPYFTFFKDGVKEVKL